MATIISVHSFRGGTGKSNTTANVAAELARKGQRVGVIDTDIQSPGIHVLFGLAGESITASLNDYLWGGSADRRRRPGCDPAGCGTERQDLSHSVQHQTG